MSRTVASLCVAGLTSLALITPTAAHADNHGARGEANALTATILGQPGDTGTVVATNDGTGEEKNSDAVNPPLTVLTGQPYVGIGVLAQDAIATDDGTSAACAGVAGDGGSANVIEIGDTDCIEPGDNVDLTLANLDLSVLLNSELIEGSELSLGGILGELTGGQLNALVTALQSGVDEVAAQAGNTGLVLNAGAIESSCTYDGEAEGTTFLTNVGLGLNLFGTEVPLSTEDDFAPEPAPNTEVVTNLDGVTDLILTELRASLNNELDALSDPIFDVLIGELQTQVINQVVLQLQPALTAIEDNILRIVLNEQTRDGNSIAVTGLSAELLPGAAQFGAPTILDLDIANVGCGPFAGTGAPGAPGTTDTEGNPVPTVVDAGEGTSQWIQGGLLGGLALLVAGGTVAGLRRARS